jgi:uncharacterized protein (TIGR02145 family)
MKINSIFLSCLMTMLFWSCNSGSETTNNANSNSDTITETEKEPASLGECELDVHAEEFIDPRDGQTYLITKLGNVSWFNRNLNYEMEESFYFKNKDQASIRKEGKMYTFEAAQNACPEGWRIPTLEDWEERLSCLGFAVERHGIGMQYIGDGSPVSKLSIPIIGTGYIDPITGKADFFDSNINKLVEFWTSSTSEKDGKTEYGNVTFEMKDSSTDDLKIFLGPVTQEEAKAIKFCRCIKTD